MNEGLISEDGRWQWDGQRWNPRQQPQSAPAPTPRKPSHRGRNMLIALGAAVALIVLIVVVSVANSGSGNKAANTSTATAKPTATAPAAKPTAAPATAKPAAAPQVLLQASGTGNAETATFTAPAKYIIKYHFDNSNEPASFAGPINFSIMAVDANGSPRLGQPSINRLAPSGDGQATVQDINANPNTHLQILTEGVWSIQVLSA
jgi:hypothetical protein